MPELEQASKAQRPREYWGSCANCGQTFYPSGTHGKDCGCGYPLSAHEPACWGRDGRTPHPRNLAYGKPSRSESARQARQETLSSRRKSRSGGKAGRAARKARPAKLPCRVKQS